MEKPVLPDPNHPSRPPRASLKRLSRPLWLILVVVFGVLLAGLFWAKWRGHEQPHVVPQRSSIFRAGLSALTGRPPDYQKAMADFRKAAAAGSGRAMNNIGDLYAAGEGVPQDYQKAMFFYRKAAQLGVADAMNNIGVLYANGYGVTRSYHRAMRWFRLAATAGSAKAMIGIATLYEQGRGVRQDVPKAVKWYEKAASSTDPVAQRLAKAALVRLAPNGK